MKLSSLKNKKVLIFSKKVFLIFPEMELSSLKKEKFQKGPSVLKKINNCLIFQEMELSSAKLKKLLILQEGTCKL